MPKKSPNEISDEDMPQFVRRCFDRYMAATEDQRKMEIESKGFYVGGKLQWRPGETESREGARRPWITINRCRPAVDQVTNEARENPPGPECEPVGGGADKDDADILEGMIREYEYRSNSVQIRVKALEEACAGSRGLWELATEYADERSMSQQLILKYCEDPMSYFYDPDARLPGRSDSMWGGHIRKFSKEALINEYGNKLKVLNRSYLDKLQSSFGGWLQDALGWANDFATASTWTGGDGNTGGYYVCEFYMVKIIPRDLILYDDNVLRFDNETVPKGVEPKQDVDGDVIKRSSPVREVWKYVVTAFDVIEKTQWLGTIIPHFWVMGPEMWIDGKLYRLSLIEGAKDPQRLVNFGATSMAEITGSMTKSPFIGPEGTFDIANAQGFNPWEVSNTKMFAYMEYKPVWAHNKATGQAELLPGPIRNTWEAPIARVMEMTTWAIEQIKGATSVFFEPSLPSAQAVQSGAAIKALQAQTNIGTGNWQASLNNATQLEYWQASIILPKLYDGQRVISIVRPDTQHELVEINKDFPIHEVDTQTGKRKKKDGTVESANNIALGKFSLRVKVGPSVATRTEESISKLLDVIKIVPQILQNPQAQATLVRMLGEGNPEVESFADEIAPDMTGQMTPQAMQTQMQKLQQQSQIQQQVIQKFQQIIASKQPEIDAKKWVAALNALAGIREAEIKAGIDKAQIDTEHLEALTGMAHEAGMQAVEHEHASDLADKQADIQSQQSAQDAAQGSMQSAQDASQNQDNESV